MKVRELVDKQDDYQMMKEVLARRLKREFSENKKIKKWGLPDLIVVDGGKGQVSVIDRLLKDYSLNIPLLGLAKKRETIIYLDREQFKTLELPNDHEGLKLLIRLRDEAHRFAQSYHHHLRLKKIQV